MAQAKLLKSGDVVMHPRRREWGEGIVEKAINITHDGQTAQRVAITFKHHGRVNINTGVAPLLSKEMDGTMSSMNTALPQRAGRGWIDALEQDQQPHELWTLSQAMSDPFDSLQKRLGATLDSFRFSKDARQLIDWAIAQTNLDDPMTKYTRHELEQAFDRFARDRHNHLKDLVVQIKRSGNRAMLALALASSRYPTARAALQSAMAR